MVSPHLFFFSSGARKGKGKKFLLKMRNSFSKCVFLIFLFTLLFQTRENALVAALSPTHHIPGVHEVTGDTFSSVVHPEMSYYVLEVFYADWCGQCKNFMPDLSLLGKIYEKSSEEEVKSRLIIAKTDAIANEELSRRYEVNSFPTILLFSPGEEKPIQFDDRREPHRLSAFLSKHIPGFPLLVPPPEPERLAHVMELTFENFEEVVFNKDQDVLVLFYAPWCRFCKALYPKYQQLGELFKNDAAHVVIARIDITEPEHRNIGNMYNIHGFPTVMLFPRGEGKAHIRYEGPRSLPGLLRFMNENTSFPRLLDGDISWHYGVLSDVSKELSWCLNDNEGADGAQACRIAEELLKEKVEAIGHDVYEELLRSVMENPGEARALVSREMGTLEKRRLALPMGAARDEVTMKINILADLQRQLYRRGDNNHKRKQ